MRNNLMRVLFLLLLASSSNACSSVERKLQALSRSPSQMVVIRDGQDAYWAFPASAIKAINGNRISLAGEPIVAYCSHGEGPSEKLGPEIITLRSKWGYPGGFGPTAMSSEGAVTTSGGVTTKEQPYSLSGCYVRYARDVKEEIQAKEIVDVQ